MGHSLYSYLSGEIVTLRSCIWLVQGFKRIHSIHLKTFFLQQYTVCFYPGNIFQSSLSVPLVSNYCAPFWTANETQLLNYKIHERKCQSNSGTGTFIKSGFGAKNLIILGVRRQHLSEERLGKQVTLWATSVAKMEISCQSQDLPTFSVHGHIVNILGFVGHVVCVTTFKLCCCSGNRARDVM